MGDLSTSMKASLITIKRDGAPWIGGTYPGRKFTLYDGHRSDLQGRSLEALWRRGLVSFDVTVRLTPEGEKTIADDIRTTPGHRDFRVVD